LSNQFCTTFVTTTLSLFLLDKNNRERKKKRENKKTCEYKREGCSKIVKKWLYKYHFSLFFYISRWLIVRNAQFLEITINEGVLNLEPAKNLFCWCAYEYTIDGLALPQIKNRLNCTFSPIFFLIVRFCTPSFFERFCTPSFANCILFKIIIKRGEIGQKMECKIAQKNRGAKSHNWQKDRGKSEIKHKKIHLTRNGAKRWGAKSLKKKTGCKIAQLT